MAENDVSPWSSQEPGSAGKACPHLGWPDDQATHFAYPHNYNHCYAGLQVEPIELHYQSSTCLTGDWSLCPRYQAAKRRYELAPAGPSLREKRQRARARRRSCLLPLGALLVAALALGGLFLILRHPPQDPDAELSVAAAGQATLAAGSPTTGPAPSATSPLTATPLPSPTVRPTDLPTTAPTTVLPTQTATASPSPSATSTRTALPSPSPRPTRTTTPSPSPSVPPTATASPSPTEPPDVTPATLRLGERYPWTVVHVVQTQETLARIAANYGSSVGDVVAASGLSNPNLIHRGQVLIVPLDSAKAAMEATPVLTGTQATAEPSFPLSNPVLQSPGDGETVGGSFILGWAWDQKLGAGQFFVLELWRGEQPGPCRLFFATQPEFTLQPGDLPADTFSWTVRIVQGRQNGEVYILERFLSPPGPRATFAWSVQP